MKQVLGCFGIILVIILVSVYAFDRVVEKKPQPLRDASVRLFETPEIALETWIYAKNQRDYQLYLECLGKSGNVEVTEDDQYDMKLWSWVLDYEITKRKRYENLVIIQLRQNVKSPNGNAMSGLIEDYYFHAREGRWVYLPPGLERSIVWIKSLIWDVVS